MHLTELKLGFQIPFKHVEPDEPTNVNPFKFYRKTNKIQIAL